MCCEDVKIDYSKNSIARLVNLTAADQEIVSPDPHRWSLAFGQVISGTVWLMPDATAVLGSGFALGTVQAPLILTRYDVGNLVGKGWRCIHTVGGILMLVVETFVLPGGPCGEPNRG